jgi:hypothetical protein
MKRDQKGFTLIGFVFAAVFACVMGLLALKIVPVYLDYFAITRSIKQLDQLDKAKLQGPPVEGKAYLKEYLHRKLYINEVRFIKKKDMVVKRKRKVYEVSVPYTIERNLVGNIYLLFRFNPVYEIKIK